MVDGQALVLLEQPLNHRTANRDRRVRLIAGDERRQRQRLVERQLAELAGRRLRDREAA